MTAIDNRPRLHYGRNVSDAIGQMVGPTLHGEYLVLDEVLWDAEANVATAFFRNATTADFEAKP